MYRFRNYRFVVVIFNQTSIPPARAHHCQNGWVNLISVQRIAAHLTNGRGLNKRLPWYNKSKSMFICLKESIQPVAECLLGIQRLTTRNDVRVCTAVQTFVSCVKRNKQTDHITTRFTLQAGRTPLHYAASSRDGGHVYKLLVSAGASDNIPDSVI